MASSNYKKRRMKASGQEATHAVQMLKDPDQPDTVGFILGLPDHQQPSGQKTKIEMMHIKERLKKEEKEAWFETTKNIISSSKKVEPELVALKQLLRAGLPEDDLVDV